MRKIKSIILFIVLSMVILVVLPTFANINIDRTVADIKGRAGDIVYDYADILNTDTELQVREIINNIRYDANKGFEMVVITTKESSGDLEGEANKLYNGIGIGRNDRGLLLYITVGEPRDRVRLEVGRGLEGDLNDAKAGRILDNYFVPYRSQGNYDSAVKETVDVLYRDIIKGEQINNVSENEFKIPSYVMLYVSILVWLVIGIFVIIISVKEREIITGAVIWFIGTVASVIANVSGDSFTFIISCVIYFIAFWSIILGMSSNSLGSSSSWGSSWGSDSDSGSSFGGGSHSFGGGFSSGGGASR